MEVISEASLPVELIARQSTRSSIVQYGPTTLDSFSPDQVKKIFDDLNIGVHLVQMVNYDVSSHTIAEVKAIEEANAWAIEFNQTLVERRPRRRPIAQIDQISKHTSLPRKLPAELSGVWILPFHFDLESAEAIGKYYRSEVSELFNSVNDQEIWTSSRQLQYAIISVDIDSTNFLLLSNSRLLHFYSLFVSYIQLGILIYLVYDLDRPSGVISRTIAEMIFLLLFILPFVSFYISATMVNSLSDQAFASIFNAYQIVPKQFQNMFVGIIFGILSYALCPLFLIYWGTYKNRIAFCFLFEFLLSTLAIVVVSAIVTGTSGIIDILFNFTGVLVVLDIDNCVASMLKYTTDQAHLCYRNVQPQNGWILTGDAPETTRRGLGWIIAAVFYIFLAVKFILLQ